MTPEEYIVIEDVTPYRSEYYDGAMVAMVDRTHTNAQINMNVMVMLHERQRAADWEVMGSSMRVLIESIPLYTYPDASVMRRPVRTAKFSDTTMVDPCLIMEVLAPRDENYARCATFPRFQQIAALQDYLIISQEQPRVDHYSRFPEPLTDQWLYTPYIGLDSVLRLPSLGVELPLKAIYEDVEFPLPGATLTRKHPDHDRIF